MTSKPKKFRIRRSSGGAMTPAGQPVSGPRESGPPQAETGAESGGGAAAQETRPPEQQPQNPQRLSPDEESFLSPREEIEQIKREGLTGRQLRVARREAQKNGLNPASDLDAVRLLRKNGIDPFKRSDLLELVVSNQDGDDGPQNLPAAIRHAPPPSIHVLSPEERARDVMKIQRDLARRRRRRLALLLVKLAFFVFLPTAIAGYYYYAVATPMYATNSEFVIQQSDSTQNSGLGGLFAGTGMATSQDSITVQSYLNSRDAMLRLDQDHGFKKHFQQPEIDTLQRLAPDASNEAAYRVYQKRVKIGYDPTEGIVKMEVVAASPEASKEFSEALIGYAEEQVDNLTQRLREDQMQGARASYEEAESKLTAANRRVLALQERRGIVSAESELAGQMQQINTFELELKNRRLELAELLDNPRPNPTRVEIAEKAIARLETLIGDMRARLTESDNGADSLAKTQGELIIAQADVATRQLMLSQSLQQLETARVEANRQVRYLSLGVRPVPPDEPTYPRAFENTVLAFLAFGGIYLMISLTVSILREQISG